MTGLSCSHTQIAMSPASSTKANGNIGSLGLKAKSADKEDVTSKKALLDEHVDTGKRKLQTLPVFATQDECEPPAEAKDETAMQRREDRLCAHCHEKRHAARQSTS
jgi:ATP-dependent RNA helicase DDX46/PRP5